MNIENVNTAIAIMERVKARGDKLDMSWWQAESCDDPSTTEEELHSCGTAACFAGWIAVSPEWIEQGGSIDDNGAPVDTDGDSGDEAIKGWLEIEEREAEILCATGSDWWYTYGTRDAEIITVDDVLTVLYRLRDTGSVYASK